MASIFRPLLMWNKILLFCHFIPARFIKLWIQIHVLTNNKFVLLVNWLKLSLFFERFTLWALQICILVVYNVSGQLSFASNTACLRTDPSRKFYYTSLAELIEFDEGNYEENNIVKVFIWLLDLSSMIHGTRELLFARVL